MVVAVVVVVVVVPRGRCSLYHTPAAPIVQSLHGRSQSSQTFEPLTLLVMPGTTNSWLDSNPIPTLTEAAYKRWLKDLQLPQPKLDTLNRNLAKAIGLVEPTTGHRRHHHLPRHRGYGYGSNEAQGQHLLLRFSSM